MSIGWIITGCATSANMILIGRALCGVTSLLAVPGAYTYAAEISSSSNRGFFGLANYN